MVAQAVNVQCMGSTAGGQIPREGRHWEFVISPPRPEQLWGLPKAQSSDLVKSCLPTAFS